MKESKEDLPSQKSDLSTSVNEVTKKTRSKEKKESKDETPCQEAELSIPAPEKTCSKEKKESKDETPCQKAELSVPAPEKTCSKGKKESKEETPCQKPERPCDTKDICLNCPLCYVMIPSSVVIEITISQNPPLVYKPYGSNYLFDHYSAVWKPPNA